MTELFLHHVWQYQLFDHTNLCTTDNESVEIQTIGTHNIHAGPDFLNAKIQIGSTLWVGNVEIHVHASDWNKHKHYTQKEYNTVILHVVAYNDKPIQTEHSGAIPTLVLPITDKLLHSFELLSNCSNNKTCKILFQNIDTFYANIWYDRLVIERFETKANKILQEYEASNSSWEITCYKTIARAFGSPLNTIPFEMLADSVDIKILAKHATSQLQLEALLLGQAGFLDSNLNQEYTQKLQQEYSFLQKKYSLTPIHASIWKFSKMRPFSFPTIRIAQLCKLIHNSHSLTSYILECSELEQLIHFFSFSLHEFWDTHYTLREESPHIKKNIGTNTIHTIIINAIIPFLFAYGCKTGQDEYKDRALCFLEAIPSEQNSIISNWETYGIQSHSAFRSQALLQLHNEYCNQKRCLQCAFGHIYFKHILE